VFDAVTATIGVYVATCGMLGYFRRPLALPMRAVLCLAGLAAIVPDSQFGVLFPGFVSLTGIAVGGAVLLIEYLATRGQPSKQWGASGAS
jgi:hypothetical protein